MSKANQAFKQNDEAVSPVIGVILMVAITVVLAAVVFVLVSNLGKSGNSAPTFVVTRDDATDRLTVTSADSDANWQRLSIKTNSTTPPPHFQLNAIVNTGSEEAGDVSLAGVAAETASNAMSAGEYLHFCVNSGAGATADFTFTLVDTAANQVIGNYNFNDLAVCA